YVDYYIDSPKYTPYEALERNTTYSSALRIRVRLVIYDVDSESGERTIISAKESEVYLCDVPLITERGSFIVNGVERVIVNQLHRSPGIFFEDLSASKNVLERHIYSARIIPYRGSWLDFEFDAKNLMYARIDKRKKIPVTIILKALGLSNKDILHIYYDVETVKINENGELYKVLELDKILGRRYSVDITDEDGNILVKANRKITKAAKKRLEKSNIKEFRISLEDLLDSFFAEDVITENGEVILEANTPVSDDCIETLKGNNIKEFKVLYIDKLTADSAIRDLLAIDGVENTDEAIMEIYKRQRPGEPATVEIAKNYFDNIFFNEKRYDLSKVGRLKINRRLGLDIPLDVTVLTKDDIIAAVKLFDKIRLGVERVDDIDHLGHRRVKSVGEQFLNHIRIGLVRMEKTIKERMSVQELDELTPQDLLNAKPLNASIKEFFGSYQLSQFMDQTNPLTEITHKRRLSALGPGGLNRERAGFEVRDVHPSHYGRICPIETPEGPNIGLITTITTYAKINDFGFIETPYRKVVDGRVTDEVVYLSAIEEEDYYIAQANALVDENGRFIRDYIAARYKGEATSVPKEYINLMDVDPSQIVSISTALIPFLEHDDANRALMGSNMQRQAVPLIKPDAPFVGTGLERKVAVDSGAALVAKRSGYIEYVDSEKIIIRYTENNKFDIDVYELVKYKRSNQDTCVNYKPLVNKGEFVNKGDILADGPSVDRGELALGKNVLIALMPWMGYNFEDAMVVSQKLVKEDAFTSIHIESFDIEARDTKLGPEEITRDIPNMSEESLKDLDDSGVIRIGAYVKSGDILVGKVTPKGESQTTPEERLLRAIFGEKAGEVKDASLRVPPGVEGVVVDVQVMTRKGVKKDDRTKNIEEEKRKKLTRDYHIKKRVLEKARFESMLDIYKERKLIKDVEIDGITLKKGDKISSDKLSKITFTSLLQLPVEKDKLFEDKISEINETYFTRLKRLDEYNANKSKKIEMGDELSAGILKYVKVHIAIKRKLSEGDKMAGRHGNKGVIAKILPEEDMPFLEDGTPVDIVLNPLGVPSRMNVGQVLESHLGVAAKALGLYFETPVFDGAKEKDIDELLIKAGFQKDGQRILYDGRSGEPFEQEVTVGVMYIMKLHHLVDTKIHARSTGPYSLVTQQPLGGKAQFGGQRLGEMEVWALEAYGAANMLQEMLTVKSDDVEGRTRVYEAIVNGDLSYKPSMPESFNVLIKELQGLCLDVELIATKEERDKTPSKEAKVKNQDGGNN
ncbi:MAG: DNA-directed RNA polymerase subunit beta, partial [Deferribacterota bacterium]|nr:DNA-directed RNA polymerase subunit beta [Deferribacterota bacterium]